MYILLQEKLTVRNYLSTQPKKEDFFFFLKHSKCLIIQTFFFIYLLIVRCVFTVCQRADSFYFMLIVNRFSLCDFSFFVCVSAFLHHLFSVLVVNICDFIFGFCSSTTTVSFLKSKFAQLFGVHRRY